MVYDLQSYLNEIYEQFPEGKHMPIIGITTNHSDIDATLREVYYEQIVKAGGTPILLPPVADKDVILNSLQQIDGLLLTGGADINPLWTGEEPSPNLQNINAKRDLSELMITQLAFNRQIPIMGICRGVQTMAIALGGKVEQDISKGCSKIKHSQDADREEATHSVTISQNSVLHSIYKKDKIFVNSFHHQAVKAPGKHFLVSAVSADGIIEAIESAEHKPLIGVQWHPEWMGEEGGKLFSWFVKQADYFHTAKLLHKRILTLDSHCDTPMFFPQGVHFEQRDARILCDLHKMTEGRQDAVSMVAYLPQPKQGEVFSSKIDIEGLKRHNPDLTEQLDNLTPYSYTNLIFDKIEQITKQNSKYLNIARTPSDLYKNKREKKKSIILAIENGLALEGKLENVQHFAQRGVSYITLCHNGDNDICDSARGSNTHGGVSNFGAKVIREMNKHGIMVDLSHGGEKSFYDTLDISTKPIVCSHSNCKALCNVPRNLTDDQMRALAKKDGVAHITLYQGFLQSQSEATILHAIEHLEHAIKIMGIDYVGIGTDFDGDGTVIGLADSSEMINFTLHLLRRKYNECDIEKIWGGNWLRVMTQVQQR